MSKCETSLAGAACLTSDSLHAWPLAHCTLPVQVEKGIVAGAAACVLARLGQPTQHTCVGWLYGVGADSLLQVSAPSS